MAFWGGSSLPGSQFVETLNPAALVPLQTNVTVSTDWLLRKTAGLPNYAFIVLGCVIVTIIFGEQGLF